jgi:hypothetical protein
MRLPGRRPDPESRLDSVGDVLAAVRQGAYRKDSLKAALVAGSLAALIAGSAAVSALRRRMESQG